MSIFSSPTRLMLNLVIVDDHAEIRKNLKQVFDLFDDIQLCASFTNGMEAVDGIHRLTSEPDVVLMDIEMPRMNGIEATKQLKHSFPNLAIVMLTVSEDNAHILEAIKAGADGYLLKGEKPLKMIELLKLAKEGRFPMSPNVAMHTMKLMADPSVNQSTKRPEDFGITPRELDVLAQITEGKNYNEIADQLFISPKTVRTHTENLYRKLEVHSKVEASKIALQNRWV